MNDPTTQILNPEKAGEITRLLLEYSSVNRMRELVNTLQNTGVSLEEFHVWCNVSKSNGSPVPSDVEVDVYNMMSHLQKGIDIKADQLNRLTKSTIKKEVKKTVDAHRKLQAIDQL